MEESTPKRTSNKAILAQVNVVMSNQEMVMSSQQEFKDELRHMRDVVIGNGDDSSLLHQVKELQFGQTVAKKDRERMETKMTHLNSCVTGLERDEQDSKNDRANLDKDQKKMLDNMEVFEETQKKHGKLIEAFRNRVIGIVAVLSLLAGAGAGFAVAAKLLSTAVP